MRVHVFVTVHQSPSLSVTVHSSHPNSNWVLLALTSSTVHCMPHARAITKLATSLGIPGSQSTVHSHPLHFHRAGYHEWIYWLRTHTAMCIGPCVYMWGQASSPVRFHVGRYGFWHEAPSVTAPSVTTRKWLEFLAVAPHVQCFQQGAQWPDKPGQRSQFAFPCWLMVLDTGDKFTDHFYIFFREICLNMHQSPLPRFLIGPSVFSCWLGGVSFYFLRKVPFNRCVWYYFLQMCGLLFQFLDGFFETQEFWFSRVQFVFPIGAIIKK